MAHAAMLEFPPPVARRPHRLSLFAQPLDRVAFVAYFLGAVVPLAALAWVVHRWVWPALQGRGAFWSVAALLASIGVLSLVSFLALRRTAHASLARLDVENKRLQTLLRAARSLSATLADEDILRQTAAAAAAVSGAHAGFHLRRVGEDQLRWNAGGSSDARFRQGPVQSAIEEAVENAIDSLAPAIRGAAGVPGSGVERGLAVAIPCALGDGQPGALAIWHDDSRPFDPAVAPILSTLAAFATVALRNAEHHETERNFFAHATNLLVTALDAHIAHQTDHSRRVARVANQIGRRMSLTESRLERLHFAALLHDLGMLRVDRSRLGDLGEVRRHAALGGEMLQPIRLWEDLAPIVRHHHEWFDGSGYPDRIGGETIPLESRIIAVAETFDALTSDHSYQQPVSKAEAISRIEASTGVQFDPQVVNAFLEIRDELPAS